MLEIKSEDDFKVGDFVRLLNDLDNTAYGVIVKYRGSRRDFPYYVRLISGYTIWMSEWDLEKVA